MIDFRQLKEDNKALRKYNQERIAEKRKEYEKTNPDSEWGPNTQSQTRSIRNSLRRDRGLDQLSELQRKYEIEQLTPYQFRVDNQIDIYPTNRKYHIIKTGERGVYNNLKKFLEKELNSYKEVSSESNLS